MKDNISNAFQNSQSSGNFGTDSTGRLRDWNDDVVSLGGEVKHQAAYQPQPRQRKSTSEHVRQTFGNIEEIEIDPNEIVAEMQPVVNLLRRKRKSTVTIIRELFGV